ncbi:MAG: PSD1 and planctomycete cytochrome C domain-containing protein [Pseudohongiellaceae bacterium]
MRALRALLGSNRVMLAAAVAVLGMQSPGVQAQSPDVFTHEIRPIMERTCWNCHSDQIQSSGLNLSTREGALQGGSRGPAIVPGRAEESRIYRQLTGIEGPLMPLGVPLTADEIEAVRNWINAGAHWDSGPTTVAAGDDYSSFVTDVPDSAREYWAFKLPVQSPLPDIAGFDHPIDRFLEEKRQSSGITPAPQADQTTLLRRAYLDLTGLPPTVQETEQYLADTDPGAWERLIDRLLASPHYGERWGRHWLDVARYADSDGYEQDVDRANAWRYRDYVVDAFNSDKPYNRFIVEQVAGDELDETTFETRIATGFLRAGPRVNFREKDNPERRWDYLDDVLATLGRGVLGMTIQCARCHDHKFDPILQKDYYGLTSSLFGYVETDYPMLPDDQAQAYLAKTAQLDERVSAVRERIREIEQPYLNELKVERIRQDFPKDVLDAVLTPEDERTDGQKLLAAQVLTIGVPRAQLDAAMPELEKTRREVLLAQISGIEVERPPQPVMIELVTDGDYRYTPDRAGDNVLGCPECRIQPDKPGSFLHEGPGRYEVPPANFLIRGDPFSLGPEMTPAFLTVATYGDPLTEIPRPNGRTSGRRLALAQWLSSDQNPLTARVWVNRVWHHHFGRGIVASLDNFGRVGDLPTHPELLDWLAVEFQDQAWSTKQLHRLIMTSSAYKMTSAYDSEVNLANDLENHLMWRYRPQRLEAEAVRDVIMATSGGIDLAVGGKPIFPYIPQEILDTAQAYGRWDNQIDGPDVWRRSLYVYRRRTLSYPFFETFDMPDQNITLAYRNTSTVAPQALTLLNNPFILGQAQLFARRVEEQVPYDVGRQVDLVYRTALTRSPTAAESAIGRELVEFGSLEDLTHVVFNLSEFLYRR